MRDSTSPTRPQRKVGRTFSFDRGGERPRRYPRATVGERRRDGGRAASEPTGSSSGGGRPAPSPRRRILVVDDHPIFRDAVADLLATVPDMEVVGIAGTADEASTAAAANPPDVVLMDLRLPDIDGAQAARRLREDARTGAIPLVALSALSLQGNDDWLREAGFAGWMEKPIHVATFAEQVRGYCSEATR